MPNKTTIIFDRITGALSTFYGGPIPAPMEPNGAIEVFQGDRLLVNLRVVETLSPGASQTAVDLTSPASPSAVRINVRASRSSTATQYSFADTYNEGYDTANEDLSIGRITWALSFDTAALDTALAATTDDYVIGHADFSELRTILGTQFPTTFFGLTIKIYKQVDGGDVETHSGTAQAGGASTITLASGASATDDIYNGFYILITGGTGAGQENTISDYVGSTKVATVADAWTTTPDATSTYQIRASRFSTTILTDAEVVLRTPEVQTFSGTGTIVAANGISTVYVSGSPTLTLPSASSYSRMGFRIINTDGGTTTINRDGTDTINSAATSYNVVGDNPALIMRDTSSHWQARQSAGITALVEDTTPQLGGQLDVNGNPIGDGTLELLTFTETASAVNQLNVANADTGNGPVLSAAGDDTNIDVSIQPKGTGNVILGTVTLDGDQTVGAGQDNYVLTYDHASGTVRLEASSGGGGGGTTTMFIPASAFTPRATNGAAPATEEFATNDVNLDYLLFDGATEEFADALIQFPSTWNAGTFTATHFWDGSSGATAADTVEWETAARAYANDDAIDQAAGTSQVISDALLAVGDMHITSASPAITAAGSPATGQPIRITVSRNVSGTDDMTEDAKWFGVMLTWTNS